MKKLKVLFLLFFLFLSPLLAKEQKPTFSLKRLTTETKEASNNGNTQIVWENLQLYFACAKGKEDGYQEMQELWEAQIPEHQDDPTIIGTTLEMQSCPLSLAKEMYLFAGKKQRITEAKRIYDKFLKGKIENGEAALLLAQGGEDLDTVLPLMSNLNGDEKVTVYACYTDNAEYGEQLFNLAIQEEQTVTNRKAYYTLMANLALQTDQRVLARKYTALAQQGGI